ncbi:MAG: hypothetical protein Athens071426_663 [Parcubacteria group bacterium Athens0714_26]|nr:MAG: hypothetical protein Athens101426_482 [Parcubacteria group bacterium Athens1014_26]TSD01542.1 MAG: hypothetical protein Athens071426_663 [Parcubacteria group bacterium Athens0714_26]
MNKNFKAAKRVAPPKSRHEVEEFGMGKKGLIICENCNNFYYQKSWHHNADNFVAMSENKDLQVHFAWCPACQMIKNHQYEGKITIKNIPDKIESELTHLIKNSGDKAYASDPMDRIIAIKKDKTGLVVTTTDNGLAHKLTKKIEGVYHKVKVKTSFVGDPSDVALFTIEFL